MRVALSSGCFIGFEDQITKSGVKAIELSGHRVERFDDVMEKVRAANIQVLSIHTPCPGRGVVLNPGATGEMWRATEQGLLEAGAIAQSCGAQYVLVHAFYCIPGDLPADDRARMKALRELFGNGGSIAAYTNSEPYQSAKLQAISNLKGLLPSWRKFFPDQRIILENLNPRLGYGGIVFQDVADIANAFDGEIGICLDVGHLTLAQAALGQDMSNSVADARDLIWSVHAHENFGGRYAVDRRWDVASADPLLQDVDIHLPFLTRYRPSQSDSELQIQADNSAFEGIFQGGAHYVAGATEAPILDGSVSVTELLGLLSDEINLVLEFDSRYAPLAEVIHEYHLADQGLHPALQRQAFSGAP